MKANNMYLLRVALIVSAVVSGFFADNDSGGYFPWSAWALFVVFTLPLAFVFSIVVCALAKSVSKEALKLPSWHSSLMRGTVNKFWLGILLMMSVGVGFLLRGIFDRGIKIQLGMLLVGMGAALLAGIFFAVRKLGNRPVEATAPDKERSKKKLLRIAGTAVTLVSFIPLCFGVVKLLQTRSFLVDSVRSRGTIVGWVELDGDGETLFRPIISFVDAEGGTHEFSGGNASTNKGYNVGDSVSIIYKKADPSLAKVNSFSSLWLFGVMLLAMGTGSFAVGLCLRAFDQVFVNVFTEKGS